VSHQRVISEISVNFMKIAIISDTHDNVPNLEKALKWMKDNNIEALIHCGDLCAPSILKTILAPQFAGPIHMVFGNVEDRDLTSKLAQKFNHVTHHGDVGETEIDDPAESDVKKIAFVHFPEKGKELAESGNYDIVFYGHTHKPWEEKVNGIRLVNPGTLAGMFNKATFAVYDTKTDELELKVLEQL